MQIDRTLPEVNPIDSEKINKKVSDLQDKGDMDVQKNQQEEEEK